MPTPRQTALLFKRLRSDPRLPRKQLRALITLMRAASYASGVLYSKNRDASDLCAEAVQQAKEEFGIEADPAEVSDWLNCTKRPSF